MRTYTKTQLQERRQRIQFRRKNVYPRGYRVQMSERVRIRSVERRKQVIKHYGNKCACCGETEYKFLTLDHINGGGNKHRKEVGHGDFFIRWVIENNYPKILQVLCYNCNCAKGFWKVCPHQKGKAK